MIFQHTDWELRRQQKGKRRHIIRISILSVVCLLIVFLALYQFTDIMYGLTETIESSAEPGEWAMFRHDLSHTGSINPGATIPEGNVKWTFEADAPIHSSPAVVDGIVYFGSRGGTFYALDAVTGEERWTFKAGSWIESSPAVVDGVVYVGSNDSNLYALDAATGDNIWTFETVYAIRSSPAIANGMVYIGSDDYRIYAVDIETGAEIWSYEADNMIISSPAVSEGYVIVGSVDGFLHIMSATNGRGRLKLDTKRSVVASPVVRDGIAYFAHTLGGIYAVDITAKNWPFENRLKLFWNVFYFYGVAPKPPAPSGYLWGTDLWARTSSSPALADDILYMGVGNRLITINITTRQAGWSYGVTDDVVASPAVTENAVYFGSHDGHFYAVDRATGTLLWEVATGDMITSSPAVSSGVVYFGSHDGNLYAIE
jgi:outer membrane protein assembly factor BamB